MALLIEIGSTSKTQPNVDVQNEDAFDLLETFKTMELVLFGVGGKMTKKYVL